MNFADLYLIVSVILFRFLASGNNNDTIFDYLIVWTMDINFNFYDILVYGQDICNVQGECLDSYQIDHSITDTYLNCQKDCQSTTNCNYFTFYEPDNFCKLLYNCTNIDLMECPECYTGQKDCPEYVCSQPGECEGNFVDDTFLNTEQECLEYCFNDPECQWYSFDTIVGYCLLTSNCNPRNTSTPQVYGQRECYNSSSTTNPSQ